MATQMQLKVILAEIAQPPASSKAEAAKESVQTKTEIVSVSELSKVLSLD